MIILGFGFKAQVGKSTACYYLEKKYEFKHDAFAWSLKQGIGAGVFGLTNDQMEDSKLKETIDPFWDMTPRQIMQRAGTEAMRNTFSKDIWVKTLQKRLHSNPDRMYAIADIRYKNEAEAIKAMGGKVIRIDRETNKIAGNHLSETEMLTYDLWDDVIDNNSTFTGLYNQIDKLVQKYSGI